METALTVFGGLLVLLSVGVGALMRTRLFESGQSAPSGDRISAGVIGMGLIGIAVVLRIDAPTVSIASTFGVTTGLAVLYAGYLYLTRTR